MEHFQLEVMRAATTPHVKKPAEKTAFFDGDSVGEMERTVIAEYFEEQSSYERAIGDAMMLEHEKNQIRVQDLACGACKPS
jgi:hypothetical protein